jgi:hypothetical protein
LTHAIGDHVLRRDHRDSAIGIKGEEPHHVPVSQAVEQSVSHSFEAELEIRVNPSAGRHACARGAYEPLILHKGFKDILPVAG